MPAPGASPGRRAAVFLDRDGVLNRRHWRLVRRPDECQVLPGVPEAVARLTRAGFAVSIATNQEWVGHGYITLKDHEEIMRLVVDACESGGGAVDGVYACTHRRGSPECDDRKPRPGMLIAAARDLGLDLRASYMVGDNLKDMLAGRAAGCRTVLVDPRLRTWLQRAHRHADHVARDLPAAADWILAQQARELREAKVA